MPKKIVALGLVVGLWLFGLVACNNSVKPTKKTEQPCAPISTPVATGNGSGALIVTDISGSVKGFTQLRSVCLFSIHEAMERALRNALAPVEANAPIKRCYLGNEMDCQTTYTLQAMDNPATYSATESRLDLFFAPDAKAGTDPLDPHRIAVLITDGMQAQQPGSDNAGPCMGGADPNCIAQMLKQRAEKGYGIWIGLLLVPFKGTHFAERPLDDGQWQSIQQHVASLGQDPAYQGVSFSVQRGGGTPFKSFTFQGVKPLMVLALSKDVELGRRFIEQFASLTKAANVAQPVGAVYTMELAPLAVKMRKVTKISLAPTAVVEGTRPVEGKRQGEIFDYLLECENNGSAVFVINTDDQSGTNQLPDGVGLTYNLVAAESSSFPKGRLTITSTADKTYDARLSCQQIKQGSYEAWFKLQAELKMDTSKPAFWNSLSCENTFEAPERMYGLKYVTQAILEAVTAQPRVTDCLRFRIERK